LFNFILQLICARLIAKERSFNGERENIKVSSIIKGNALIKKKLDYFLIVKIKRQLTLFFLIRIVFRN